MRGAFSLVLLLGGVNAACRLPAPAGDDAPDRPVSGDAPTPVWTVRTGRRLTGRVELKDGQLYGAGVDRKVYAVDLETGEVQWSSRLSGLVAGGPVSGDTIYVASSRPEGRVYALDRSTGQRIWRAKTGPVGAPLAVDGTLLVPAQRSQLLGLNPADGSFRWRRRMGMARIAPLNVGWGAVVVATVDSLYRVMAADGEVTHRVRSPGTIVSPGSCTGVFSWRAPPIRRSSPSRPPISRPAGASKWTPPFSGPWRRWADALRRQPTGDAVPPRPGQPARAGAGGRVGLASHGLTAVDGDLLPVAPTASCERCAPDGTEAWRIQLWRPVELSPVALDDGILAIGGNGDLHRYRQ